MESKSRGTPVPLPRQNSSDSKMSLSPSASPNTQALVSGSPVRNLTVLCGLCGFPCFSGNLGIVPAVMNSATVPASEGEL